MAVAMAIVLNIGVVPFICQNLRTEARCGNACALAAPDGLICEHASARPRITYVMRRIPSATTSIGCLLHNAAGPVRGEYGNSHGCGLDGPECSAADLNDRCRPVCCGH